MSGLVGRHGGSLVDIWPSLSAWLLDESVALLALLVAAISAFFSFQSAGSAKREADANTRDALPTVSLSPPMPSSYESRSAQFQLVVSNPNRHMCEILETRFVAPRGFFVWSASANLNLRQIREEKPRDVQFTLEKRHLSPVDAEGEDRTRATFVVERHNEEIIKPPLEVKVIVKYRILDAAMKVRTEMRRAVFTG